MLPPGCEARCPACSHRELSESESIERKSQWLARALAPWRDRIEKPRSVSGPERLGYRNKSILHAARGERSWRLGMKIPVPGLRGKFEVVAIPDCPVHSARVRETVRWVSGRFPLELPLAFVSVSGALLTLVLKCKEESAPGLSELFGEHSIELARIGIEGAFVNFNPSAGDRVFSTRGWKHLWGKAFAESMTGRHGPQSFQQLIPSLHADALAEAESWLAPGRETAIVDLYSGTGGTIRRWREAGAEAIGVELVGESVRIAGQIAGDGILQGRVEERIPQLKEWLQGRSQRKVLLYSNPPRTGMDEEVLAWIVTELRPEKIAYLSCSAGTLARDLSQLAELAKLEESAYRVKRIIPYDFFPQTEHVETLACLERDSTACVSHAVSR